LSTSDAPVRTGAKVVVATTVALAFISFWRAASIVLSDLASSAFYAGGIAEKAIGPSAPWFVLGVMLFSFAVRSVYLESSSMFVRGGVYVVVRDAMGPVLARVSVSSLLFDYILTGPISVVAAGQYLAGLVNEISTLMHWSFVLSPNWFSAGFAVMVTIYFWWENTKGMHESSGKALRIMQITTVMVVIFLIWCPLTLIIRGPAQIPPAPLPHNLRFDDTSLGWFRGTIFPTIPLIAVVIAFGHSLLSMSGFETLAQVYREIAYPKLKNLRITGNIVCIYAAVCTGGLTMFAAMIIPDKIRPSYVNNLLGGLAMNLAGPEFLRLGFHVFVVFVGVLILSGAVNTSMIGGNGVMNRVAEDGILIDWFRKPHRRFGTTYRIVNLIALLQIVTILLSGGNVDLLGEAYAFGVVWSFFLKALGVLVLRYHRHDQEYKVPGNITVAGIEIPIGLAATTILLGATAVANLFSKPFATIYGLAFTIILFIIFTVSEHINRKKMHGNKHAMEEFNLDLQPAVETGMLKARPGSILIAVRDVTNLSHLRSVIHKTNMRRHDIVVMTVRQITSGEYELAQNQLFTDYERELFSKVVEMAEKEGKTVELLVVPSPDPFEAIMQTAQRLQASRVVTGASLRMDTAELARRIGLAWEKLEEPRHAFSLEILQPDKPSFFVNLGPHPPRLWPEDVERVHNLWLRLSQGEFGSKLHHRDILGTALRRMERDLEDPARSEEALRDVDYEVKHH
jgi:amino acid transporter/nucleotide-binding universal stress UspA family protein